jgi:hypothetical protein
MRAAVVLVLALALGVVVTERAAHTARPPAPVFAPPAARPRETAAATRSALDRLVPPGAQCLGGMPAHAAHCSIAGIEVDYRLTRADALRARYLAALVPGLSGGSTRLGRGSGPPLCAHGAEDERAWSRPATPTRTAGRYACRIEAGRAEMWWTVDDRGLLAHAVAPYTDLAALFAWWESHSER